VNQGDIEQAMNKIRQYVNSGGVVFDGLKKRRDDEITLFTKAKYQYHGVDLPRQ
jgi:GH24 family phage-related lysozyme (muramidase)